MLIAHEYWIVFNCISFSKKKTKILCQIYLYHISYLSVLPVNQVITFKSLFFFSAVFCSLRFVVEKCCWTRWVVMTKPLGTFHGEPGLYMHVASHANILNRARSGWPEHQVRSSWCIFVWRRCIRKQLQILLGSYSTNKYLYHDYWSYARLFLISVTPEMKKKKKTSFTVSRFFKNEQFVWRWNWWKLYLNSGPVRCIHTSYSHI